MQHDTAINLYACKTRTPIPIKRSEKCKQIRRRDSTVLLWIPFKDLLGKCEDRIVGRWESPALLLLHIKGCNWFISFHINLMDSVFPGDNMRNDQGIQPVDQRATFNFYLFFSPSAWSWLNLSPVFVTTTWHRSIRWAWTKVPPRGIKPISVTKYYLAVWHWSRRGELLMRRTLMLI